MFIHVLLKAVCSAVDTVMSIEIIFRKSCANNAHLLIKTTQHNSDGSLDGCSISETVYIKNAV